jgi:aminomethyltransferase
VSELRRSPLHERHVALGAKMADFGGWSMPIEYSASGGGVIAEHTAVREAVGLFDVSHLGKATVRGRSATGESAGESAKDFLNRCLTNDLDRIAPGAAQYTLCCDESGGTVDDLIAYLVREDEVFLVPNAANTGEVVRRLRAAAPDGIEVTDQHEQFAVIAVQGPKAVDALARIGLLPGDDLGYMGYVDRSLDGVDVRICRTGYTGEHGYELIPAWDDALGVWDALSAAVTGLGGLPAGLGARDTLRTEMGYPLHGQDLSLDISPVQARAGWAVGWKKDAFWGRDALTAEKAAGPRRVLWGVLVGERGIPRAHMTVLDGLGVPAGEVTSGTFSPTLKRGIGLALVDTSSGLGEGDDIVLDVRGRRSAATLVKPPFVPSHVR